MTSCAVCLFFAKMFNADLLRVKKIVFIIHVVTYMKEKSFLSMTFLLAKDCLWVEISHLKQKYILRFKIFLYRHRNNT